MASTTPRTLGCLGIALLLLLGAGAGAFWWLRSRGLTDPVPGQQRCVATAGGRSVVLDLDQAHYAAIIAGVSVRRKLAPRAASIALATVYQETGIRNLDYGDRDSVGLFQQRPSQGWGTEEQLQDPYYATGKFYDALVKITDWESDDINDVAQQVQRSGHPEAYADHEADARTLASALTGHSTSAFTCLDRTGTRADAAGLTRALQKTFGPLDDRAEGSQVTVRATSARRAWAYAQFAVANAKYYGVTAVTVGDRTWRTNEYALPAWVDAETAVDPERVEITLR